MHLAVLHYHLNRGGVTSVVANQLRALALQPDPPSRVLLLHGGRAGAWNAELCKQFPFECRSVAVPALEYDNERTDGGNLTKAIERELASLDQKQTVLHIHNHSLGKNAQMASAVGELAEAGWRCLLQMHDFAEDLRPGNYQHLVEQSDSLEDLQRRLYPQAEQSHYAVLNRRDFEVLNQAEFSAARLHLLPNPVEDPHDVPSEEDRLRWKTQLCEELDLPVGNRVVLYPVRAIRRKNLGEVLLWAALAKQTSFVVTLAPQNPQEQGSYRRWVRFAEERELPVVFDSASKCDLPFLKVYAAADAILTTSVAEGFGMVYLEAALAGRPLIGRQLPSVCDDFLHVGMQFPGLAEQFAVPSKYLELSEVAEDAQQQIARLRSAYGMTAKQADCSLEEFGLTGNTLDFGRLESKHQRFLLERLQTEAALRQELHELNPVLQWLEQLESPEMLAAVEKNRQVIADHYSLQVIGQQLAELYQQLLAIEPGEVTYSSTIARSILESFVHPSQLFPLRLEA